MVLLIITLLVQQNILLVEIFSKMLRINCEVWNNNALNLWNSSFNYLYAVTI